MSERERAMLEVPELDATMRLKSILSGERLVAVEKSTGIKLVRSGGRSRRGSAPNYILIVYSSCNPRVRAWSDEEAIEAANSFPPASAACAFKQDDADWSR
jgi:hypothetical protein